MVAISLSSVGFLMSGLEAVTGAQSLGACNGRLGNDLPSEQEVVDFYKSNGIGRLRIYDPNQETLQAIRETNIELTLVGNEVKPSDAAAQFVLPAMLNIYSAIASAQFVLSSISRTGAKILSANIDNPQYIDLGYALLNPKGPAVQDGDLNYHNLFNASLNALYSALERAGGLNVEIVVSETGWPSVGNDADTFSHAEDYYQNVINHIANGTPKRPGRPIETYFLPCLMKTRRVALKLRDILASSSPINSPSTNSNFLRRVLSLVF
ncbi:hypothetical protein Peur_074139 [Populus x canadensis]